MVDNNILLLGMVFSDQLIPSRGQEYRDRVRKRQLLMMMLLLLLLLLLLLPLFTNVL